MYNKFKYCPKIFNFKKILTSSFSISNIILFIYIVSIQISNSYGYDDDDIIIYTYENVTDFIRRDINIYSNDHIRAYYKYRIKNKSTVLKFKNRFTLSYYCKNDICSEVHYLNILKFQMKKVF